MSAVAALILEVIMSQLNKFFPRHFSIAFDFAVVVHVEDILWRATRDADPLRELLPPEGPKRPDAGGLLRNCVGLGCRV